VPDVTQYALRKVNCCRYQKQEGNVSEKTEFPIYYISRQV